MERNVIINNTSVYVRQQGQGNPVLILHGWGSSSLSWGPVIEELARNNFCAYVPDLPGFGQSPEPPAHWDLPDYTEFVHCLIREMGIQGCMLVGHSFGGRIGIQLASKHPQDIRLLALCGAAGIVRHHTLKARVFARISAIGKSLPLPQRHARKLLHFLAGERDYYRASTTMRSVMSKTLQHELKGLLPSISCPTLLLWGSEDRATPVSDAKIAESLIPNNTLIVLSGYTHSLQRQAPQEVARHIQQFFNKHQS